MKVVFSLLILFTTTAVASAQAEMRAERLRTVKDSIAQANWHRVTTDSDKISWYVDTRGMSRSGDGVYFLSKSNKGETVFSRYLGNCKSNKIGLESSFSIDRVSKELIDDNVPFADLFEVEAGTVPFSLLDYVCKNTKAEPIKW